MTLAGASAITLNMSTPHPNRIMILGQPGAGKSTLALAISARTGLPCFHLDKIHWLPGWVPRPDAEKAPLIREIIAQDRWIIEGGHSATYPERLARADMVVWLDLNVWTRLRRVTWRSIRDFGKTRPDMQEGCPETFGWHTLEFYVFIWRTRNRSRQKISALLAAAPDAVKVVRLTSGRAATAFMEQFDA